MEDRINQKSAKTDWTKKGRGWIPDYPDFRDYRLDHKNINKDGRLKRDETTGAIEDLATTMIELIEKFPEKNFRCNIGDLERQAYGGIHLVDLKIYKLFRLSENSHNKHSYGKAGRAKRNEDKQSEKLFFFSSQITELKTCLSFLVLHEVIPPHSGIDFKNPNQIAKWLKSSNFDRTTEDLVKSFQQKLGIHEDGIVGFETYKALNEKFRELGETKNLKQRKFESRQGDYDNSALEVELPVIPVPLPLSHEIFAAVLDELKSTAVKQVRHELSIIDCKGNETSLQKPILKSISEVDYLEKIKCKKLTIFEDILKEPFNKHFNSYSNSLLDPFENDQKFWEELMKEVNYKNFTNLFHSEFYTIEPIISMVLKTVSPLANHRNQSMAEVICLGFKRFRMLLQQSRLQQLSEDWERAFKSNFTNDTKELKQLYQAEQALKKVQNSFRLAIEFIARDEDSQKDENKRKSILRFYFLLKKYLNWLDRHKTQVDETKTNDNRYKQFTIDPEHYEPNIFDKQEFFKIELDSKVLKSGLDSDPSQELFQPAELNIPVSNAFLDLKWLKSSCTKSQQSNGGREPYFFLPGLVDLSFWCSKIRDQGSLNSCTAFAGTALFEYFVSRSSGQYDDVSSLFLYKAARQLMEVEGDVGASVRDTMKAMAIFGIPPEDSWPYQVEKVDEEPTSFCYAYAKNFEALKYFRLDYVGIPKDILLFQIKAILTAGFPCMFGFTLYTSAFEEPNPKRGYIPYPDEKKDKVVDGHAVVAVGYDDNKFVNRANPEEKPTMGAILIRNSWGSDWGNQGYGWLPYEYILNGLTSAWWSLLKADWFQGDNFGLGGKGGEDPTGNELIESPRIVDPDHH